MVEAINFSPKGSAPQVSYKMAKVKKIMKNHRALTLSRNQDYVKIMPNL